jgi:hypothetical protein
MSERAPLPLTSPNWRPFPDAIEFLYRHFRSLGPVSAKLQTALVSGALPIMWEKDNGQREPLPPPRLSEIEITIYLDNHGRLVGNWRDEIDIELGKERLLPDKVFVWWPRLGVLVKSKTARKSRTPKKPEEATLPVGLAKRQRGMTDRMRKRRKMIIAILFPANSPDGPQQKTPSDREDQVRKAWEEKCKEHNVSSKDYPRPSRRMIERVVKDYLAAALISGL